MAVAELMKLANALADTGPGAAAYCDGVSVLARLLAPFAPHLGAELWERLSTSGVAHDPTCCPDFHTPLEDGAQDDGGRGALPPWPRGDPSAARPALHTVVIQVSHGASPTRHCHVGDTSPPRRC